MIKIIKRIRKSKLKFKREIIQQLKLAIESTEFSDVEDLARCFIWDKTPQGAKYWSRIYDKLRGE